MIKVIVILFSVISSFNIAFAEKYTSEKIEEILYNKISAECLQYQYKMSNKELLSENASTIYGIECGMWGGLTIMCLRANKHLGTQKNVIEFCVCSATKLYKTFFSFDYIKLDKKIQVKEALKTGCNKLHLNGKTNIEYFNSDDY